MVLLTLTGILLGYAVDAHADIVSLNPTGGSWGGRSFGSSGNPIQQYTWVASSTGSVTDGTLTICVSDRTGSPTDGVVVMLDDGSTHATSSAIAIADMSDCAFGAWHSMPLTWSIPLHVSSSTTYNATLSRTGTTGSVSTYATEMSSPPTTVYSPVCVNGCGGTYYPSVLWNTGASGGGNDILQYTPPFSSYSGNIDYTAYIASTTASSTFMDWVSSSTPTATDTVDLTLGLATGTRPTSGWVGLPAITLTEATDSTTTDLLLQQMGASATGTVTGMYSVLTHIAPFSWFFMIQDAWRGAKPKGATSTFVILHLADIDFSSSTAMGPILGTSTIGLSQATIQKYAGTGNLALARLLMVAATFASYAFSLYNRARLAIV